MPEMCTSVCCHWYVCLQRLGVYSRERPLTKLDGKNFSAVLIYQTWGSPRLPLLRIAAAVEHGEPDQ